MCRRQNSRLPATPPRAPWSPRARRAFSDVFPSAVASREAPGRKSHFKAFGSRSGSQNNNNCSHSYYHYSCCYCNYSIMTLLLLLLLRLLCYYGYSYYYLCYYAYYDYGCCYYCFCKHTASTMACNVFAIGRHVRHALGRSGSSTSCPLCWIFVDYLAQS